MSYSTAKWREFSSEVSIFFVYGLIFWTYGSVLLPHKKKGRGEYGSERCQGCRERRVVSVRLPWRGCTRPCRNRCSRACCPTWASAPGGADWRWEARSHLSHLQKDGITQHCQRKTKGQIAARWLNCHLKIHFTFVYLTIKRHTPFLSETSCVRVPAAASTGAATFNPLSRTLDMTGRWAPTRWRQSTTVAVWRRCTALQIPVQAAHAVGVLDNSSISIQWCSPVFCSR